MKPSDLSFDQRIAGLDASITRLAQMARHDPSALVSAAKRINNAMPTAAELDCSLRAAAQAMLTTAEVTENLRSFCASLRKTDRR